MKALGFNGKLTTIRGRILNDSSFQQNLNSYVVFISLSNGEDSATVIHSTLQKSFQRAWDEAASKAKDFIKDSNYNVKYLKVDINTSVEAYSYSNIDKLIAKYDDNSHFAKGISFNEDFSIALLGNELDSNEIIDYSNYDIDINSLNAYMKSNFLSEIPENLYVFSYLGYFCDENNSISKLSTNDLNHGTREISTLTKEKTKDIINNSSTYLYSQIQEDGSFIYGYHIKDNLMLTDYNYLRHAGTCWSLASSYSLNPSLENKELLKKAYDNLYKNITFKDENTAFLLDTDGTIKVGGNGLALLAFLQYHTTFETNEYEDIILKLANGIIAMQEEDGSYFHLWNGTNFSPTSKFVTTYYDGEATFALFKAYAQTKNETYLSHALKATDWMITNNYDKQKDQWIAYTFNEALNYTQDTKYMQFVLHLINSNFLYIYNESGSSITDEEFALACFEAYSKIKSKAPSLLSYFNEEQLLNTINQRTIYGLSSYTYPEIEMYFPTVGKYVNTFFTRNDSYRIRIDDVQHNIGGYLLYYQNYDILNNKKK